MKKLIYITFLFCVISNTKAQSYELNTEETLNYTDSLGKKQGKWKIYSKDNACQLENQKIEEGYFLNNLKIGYWVEYYCNGMIKSKLTYVDGKPDGHFICYYESGRIKEEGFWKNKYWVNNYKLYYANGKIQHDFAFNDAGKLDGNQKYYYRNGEPAMEMIFKDGKEGSVVFRNDTPKSGGEEPKSTRKKLTTNILFDTYPLEKNYKPIDQLKWN